MKQRNEKTPSLTRAEQRWADEKPFRKRFDLLLAITSVFIVTLLFIVAAPATAALTSLLILLGTLVTNLAVKGGWWLKNRYSNEHQEDYAVPYTAKLTITNMSTPDPMDPTLAQKISEDAIFQKIDTNKSTKEIFKDIPPPSQTPSVIPKTKNIEAEKWGISFFNNLNADSSGANPTSQVTLDNK